MLNRIGSSEITDWAAIFSIEDEDMEKANKGQSNGNDEDITDDLIAAIEADQAERGI